MKKLASIFLCLGLVASAVYGLNFSGRGSVNGINNPVLLFKAPTTGYYFVEGKLSLPHFSTSGGAVESRVVATLSKNQATLLYYGAIGANGFSVPQISLASNDSISVLLTSDQAAAVLLTGDGVKNAVTGQVYFGNAF